MSGQNTNKLAIFDWDGTIMDSVMRIVFSMQAAAKRAELPVPTDQAVKDIIGLSLAPAFEQLFGQLSGTQVELMIRLYKEEYLDNKHGETPVFAGVESVFKTLKQRGYLLGVATGKSRAGLDRLLAVSGFGHYFSATMTADEAESKPSPHMIHNLMGQLNVGAEHVVMIGDSQLDMSMAKQAKVRAIGVSYGAHTVEVLSQHQPSAIVGSPIELLDHLI